ncbi:hypothetical protein D3C80_1713030 [compost metagenome]
MRLRQNNVMRAIRRGHILLVASVKRLEFGQGHTRHLSRLSQLHLLPDFNTRQSTVFTRFRQTDTVFLAVLENVAQR